jgi:hypothetical protein
LRQTEQLVPRHDLVADEFPAAHVTDTASAAPQRGDSSRGHGPDVTALAQGDRKDKERHSSSAKPTIATANPEPPDAPGSAPMRDAGVSQ